MDKLITPTYSTIKGVVPRINDDLTRYLVAFTYAGCARIGEITRPDVWHAPDRAGESSIKEDDIYTKKEDVGLRFYLRLKSTKLKSKSIERNVPLNPEKEIWLCNLIKEYLESFESILETQEIKDYQEGELFPFNPSWAYKKIKRAMGINPHLLRKARATHYLLGNVTEKPMSIEFVAKIGGWVNINTLSKHYSGVLMDDVSRNL